MLDKQWTEAKKNKAKRLLNNLAHLCVQSTANTVKKD